MNRKVATNWALVTLTAMLLVVTAGRGWVTPVLAVFLVIQVAGALAVTVPRHG